MEKQISRAEAELLRKALMRNDGVSLCPDWEQAEQDALTVAMDKLRLALWKIIKP